MVADAIQSPPVGKFVYDLVVSAVEPILKGVRPPHALICLRCFLVTPGGLMQLVGVTRCGEGEECGSSAATNNESSAVVVVVAVSGNVNV